MNFIHLPFSPYPIPFLKARNKRIFAFSSSAYMRPAHPESLTAITRSYRVRTVYVCGLIKSPQNMSSPTKRVQNNWTEAQRTVLHLLYTYFTSFDTTTRTLIFNNIFKDELQAYGIHGGLGDVALHSQYRDRTRKDREHLWTNVLRVPQTHAEELERRELIKRINDAAATLEAVKSMAHLVRQRKRGMTTRMIASWQCRERYPECRLKHQAKASWTCFTART